MYCNNNNHYYGQNGYPSPLQTYYQPNPIPTWSGYSSQTATSSYPEVSSPPLQLPSHDTASDFRYPGYKIRQGDRGEIVQAIQKRLGVSANGVFDTQLEAVVRRFQTDNKISANGMVGEKTWKKMFGSVDSFDTFSVKNDTDKEAVVVWTAKKCRNQFYGISNVCHSELALPDQVQTYQFDDKTSDRRVGIVRKGSYRTLPISSSVPNKHEFSVSSIRNSGIKLSRHHGPHRTPPGVMRREMGERVQAMMNGLVSGVKERFPFF